MLILLLEGQNIRISIISDTRLGWPKIDQKSDMIKFPISLGFSRIPDENMSGNKCFPCVATDRIPLSVLFPDAHVAFQLAVYKDCTRHPTV